MQDLADLLHVLALPAYFFDMESHRLLAVNQAFSDLLGYRESELLAMTVDDLRPVEELPKLAKALASSPPEGSVEWRYRTQSEAILYVRLSYRGSVYLDKQTGRQRNIRLVVISSWDSHPLHTSDQLFGR